MSPVTRINIIRTTRRTVPFLAIALLGTACARVTIRTDFEGASLGKVERLSDTRFACAVAGQSDQDGRNRQATWYSFRVDNCRDREITIELTDLVGEYNYRPGTVPINEKTPPLYSTDQKTWRHVESVSFDKEKVRLIARLTPREETVWIAHVEPYTTSRLERFLDGLPSLRRESIGKTVEGRDLLLLSVTNPDVADAGKRVVWLMFRQHAWESGSSFAGEGAIAWLLSDAPEAKRLRDRVVFKIFPMLDPDGCARGGVRYNVHGYDLNRNWDTVDLAGAEHLRLMPEIRHAKKALHDWLDSGRKIDLFLTLHNTETAEYLSGSREFPEMTDRLSRLLRESTTFDPTREPTPRQPDAPGRFSVDAYLETFRRVPAFLMEQRIAFNAKLGRLPTSQDRLEFGAQLVRALGRAVTE